MQLSLHAYNRTFSIKEMNDKKTVIQQTRVCDYCKLKNLTSYEKKHNQSYINSLIIEMLCDKS